MVMLSKIEAYEGWLLKFLITAPDAFHDTSDFLMISVLEILRKENCRFLTKGMVPVNSLGEIRGLGYFNTLIAKGLYKIITRIFNFEKRKGYWLRYNPKIAPAYILFGRSNLGFNEIRALMKVFRTNHSSLNNPN